MPTYVALIRGINVGGRNKVAMADLRSVVASIGHTDVSTYIQSGNVIFTASDKDTTALATALEKAIANELDVRPRVVVLSRDELAKVVDANPYPDEPNPRLVHAIFLTDAPSAEQKKAVAAAEQKVREKGNTDTATFVGRTLFLHTPGGFGTSELAAILSRSSGGKASAPVGTARNWATITKLLTLCDG